MKDRPLPLSVLLALPLAVPAAAQPTAAQTPEAAPAPRAAAAEPRDPTVAVPEPGDRWTGRWIVHLAQDPAVHRAALRELGALRRARDADGVAALVAALEAEAADRAAGVAALARAHGAAVLGTGWLSHAVALEGASDALLAALASRPDVRALQPETWHEAQLEVATDDAHHASDAANLLTTPGGQLVDGYGVTIAIVDSGVDADHAGSGRPHAAFYFDGDPTSLAGPGIGGSRLLSATSESFWYPTTPAEDSCGHGTRIASIAAGAEFNALWDVDDGPAPSAALRSYKISDNLLGGCIASTFSMNQAFEALLADPGVLIANMSYDGDPDPLVYPNTSIDGAALADVVVTVSAGNFGGDMSFAHGCFDALVVGASKVATKAPLDLAGIVSAIGPLPDGRRYPHLLAVGEAVTCAKMDQESSAIDSYGSSAAAALVSGTVALVRQAAPSLSATEVRALVLNATEAVTLGDPDAAGWGYLRADRAVEAALAGEVVRETITTGVVKRHRRFFEAGEEVVLTLVWDRESPTELTIDDLDLRVRGPLGALLAWSASNVDPVEQIRFTAATSGVHDVEVVPIHFDGDGTATYALAGVDAPSVDPSACTPGPPQVLYQSPTAAPALVQSGANAVLLSGCNLSAVTSVTVGGKGVFPVVLDDSTLWFDLDVAPAVGALPLVVSGPHGSFSGTLEVVAAPNVLRTSPTIDHGWMYLDVGGPLGDFYAVGFSPDLIPTVVPGFLSIDIGNQATTLHPVLFGNLNATNGVEEFSFTGISATAGDVFHFQAVTLDAVTLLPPWQSTNVSSVLFVL